MALFLAIDGDNSGEPYPGQWCSCLRTRPKEEILQLHEDTFTGSN